MSSDEFSRNKGGDGFGGVKGSISILKFNGSKKERDGELLIRDNLGMNKVGLGSRVK